MLVVGKEAQVEIVSYLNRSRFLDQVVGWGEDKKKLTDC